MDKPPPIPPLQPPPAVPPPPLMPPPPVVPPSPPVSGSTLPRIRPATYAPPPLPRNSLLTLQELERFKNLMVFARMVVEGYFAGKHKSRWRGSSAEFAEYKEYALGDDVSNLDWRVYGRSRRLFLKQYEAETDMVVYLLVDTSASMSYHGDGRQSKYLLAAKIAAALAYLTIRQSDKAALGLFADKLANYIPPGGTRRHLFNLLNELEKVQPSSTTYISGALVECATLFRKRGLVVILSDFFADHGQLFEALSLFMHRKFRVLLLHVLDPDEELLPPVNTARFVDLETAERVEVETSEIRAEYQDSMRRRIEALAEEANRRQISHAVVSTQRPYIDAIEAYLGVRGATRKR